MKAEENIAVHFFPFIGDSSDQSLIENYFQYL